VRKVTNQSLSTRDPVISFFCFLALTRVNKIQFRGGGGISNNIRRNKSRDNWKILTGGWLGGWVGGCGGGLEEEEDEVNVPVTFHDI